MDNQKLKHGGKYLKITKDVKLVKTNISVWLSTNHLLSKILHHLQNLDKKRLVKKRVAMTTIYAK